MVMLLSLFHVCGLCYGALNSFISYIGVNFAQIYDENHINVWWKMNLRHHVAYPWSIEILCQRLW